MNTRSGLLPLCLLMFTPTLSAHADAKLDARSSIKSNYDDESVGLAKKDIDAMFVHYAPDCVFIGGPGGAGTVAESRAGYAKAFQEADKLSQTYDLQSLSFADKKRTQAIVLVKKQATMSGRPSQTGQVKSIEIDGTFRDFWVKASDGWVLKREKIISMASHTNG